MASRPAPESLPLVIGPVQSHLGAGARRLNFRLATMQPKSAKSATIRRQAVL